MTSIPTRMSLFGVLSTVLLVSAAPVSLAAQVRSPVVAPAPAVERVHPAPVAPDRIDLAVDSYAATATGALSAAEFAAQRVVRAVSASGIPVHEVRTMRTVLVPEYARPGVVAVTTIRGEHRLLGYWATTEVVVVPADPRHTGLLVDFARGAGASRVAVAELVMPTTGASSGSGGR